MLSTLLEHAEQDAQTGALARDGGRAFVSQALRPYLIAALLERAPGRPAIVVAGDDRAARALAGALRARLAPRSGRHYARRGVSDGARLTRAPHLGGLRMAARDSRLEPPADGPAPVVVVGAI